MRTRAIMCYMTITTDNFLSFVDPSDQVSVLRNLACSVIARQGYTHSMLCAHRGDDPLFLALLRPYPKGEHLEAVEELLTLALPLGADRIAFCSTGRAWSMDDPVPPVSSDGDIRQRVLIVGQGDALNRGQGHGNTEGPNDDESVFRSYLWPVEECLAGADPTILDGGVGPLHLLLEEAALEGHAIRLAQPEPFDHNPTLREAAQRLLALEIQGHQMLLLGAKLEHTLGVWLDRFIRQRAA